MAKMYGVEIKSLKKFFGHEGEPCYQGTVYYNGKKLGAWSNDSWGGSDRFFFDESVLNGAVEKYKQSLPDNAYKELTNIEIFMEAVIELAQMEKAFKKYIKQNYKVMIRVGGDWSYMLVALGNDNDTQIKSAINKYSKQFDNPTTTIYRSLNDFVIQ